VIARASPPLASFRKLDNFLGNYRDSEVVSIHKSEGSARHFELPFLYCRLFRQAGLK
jgi:hypothetical protein